MYVCTFAFKCYNSPPALYWRAYVIPGVFCVCVCVITCVCVQVFVHARVCFGEKCDVQYYFTCINEDCLYYCL